MSAQKSLPLTSRPRLPSVPAGVSRRRAVLTRAASLWLALLLPACNDEDIVVLPPAPEDPLPAAPEPNPTNPAVLVVGQVYSPEAYNTYVGIFPEVPEGDVDFAAFREFGNANVHTDGGYVFVEEEGVMQRFAVNEALQLVDGPRFGWQDFGVSAINTTSTVFVSPERAYTLAPDLGILIEWNPQTMERTGTREVDLPERPLGMETFAYDGRIAGDQVIWNLFSADWDSIVPYPAVTLVFADVEGNAPVRIVEDDRCIPGGPSYVDDNGDYYLQAGAFYGYFFVYGPSTENARTCVLRVRAGEQALDPDYVVDYRALTGSYVNDPWYHVSGSQYFARAWDPEVPFPENPDDFYDTAALRPLLVELANRTASPYADLADLKTIDGVTREVDGISYLQLSETGYVENGNTDVVELRPDGIVKKFHLNGFLLGLERVR